MKQLIIQFKKKRDFLKVYRQQAENLNDSDQNIEFIIGENSHYYQIADAYLQYEMTIGKDAAVAANRVFVNGDVPRLVKNAFAYCFEEARSSTTGPSHIEHIKNCRQISTIMRALRSKDGDLLSHFDKIDASEAEIEITSLYHHAINNHDLPANKGKFKGQILLKQIFGFFKTLKKITKQLRFHLTFITADQQDIIYTTLGDNIKVSFDKLFSYVPIIIPDAQTQIMFNDSIKKSFTLSFDSWSTDRKTVDTQLENQVDVESAQNINSLKYLIVAHQSAVRIGAPNKENNVAVFDNLNVTKYHVNIDGARSLRDGVSIDFASNDYLDQQKDLIFFYKEYVGEEILNLFINYTDMKTNYPIQVLDLRFQVDHINPKKIPLFEEERGPTAMARLFMVLTRHRESTRISEGNKIVAFN